MSEVAKQGSQSIRAYARHRGCTHRAVQRAIKTGRVSKALVVVNGRPRIADFELADREWLANTNVFKARFRRVPVAADQVPTPPTKGSLTETASEDATDDESTSVPVSAEGMVVWQNAAGEIGIGIQTIPGDDTDRSWLGFRMSEDDARWLARELGGPYDQM